MSTLAELVALGKEMGYEGAALQQFVKQQQDAEREQRAKGREALTAEREAEREARKAEQEAQARKAEQEARKAEQEREAELVQQRAAAAREQLEIQLQIVQAKKEGPQHAQGAGGMVRSPLPKLPKFDEGREDMDAFFREV